jgi:hypothetical protein
MRRVWQVASSSAEYDAFDKGTMVVDDEVDVAEASSVEDDAPASLSVDDGGGR